MKVLLLPGVVNGTKTENSNINQVLSKTLA